MTVTVRFRNPTDHKVVVYLRRDLITFAVEGPDGEKTICRPLDPLRHPARLGFTTIAAHHAVVFTDRLIELCPRWTFAKRGEYSIVARYDPRFDGKTVGLHAFTGPLDAERPVLVSVERNARVFSNHFVPRGPATPAAARATPAPPPTASVPRARAIPVRR